MSRQEGQVKGLGLLANHPQLPVGPLGIHVPLGNLGLEMESLPELASYRVLCRPEAFYPGDGGCLATRSGLARELLSRCM